MPNKDGSGPEGKGPKTGRGLGNCSGPKISNQKPLARRFLARGRRGSAANT
jgi:hypothetical protein